MTKKKTIFEDGIEFPEYLFKIEDVNARLVSPAAKFDPPSASKQIEPSPKVKKQWLNSYLKLQADYLVKVKYFSP